jgi:cell division ATPase FtsA
VGGNKIDEAIHRYIKREYNIIIGERTAEEIKINIGSAYPMIEEITMEVRGRDMIDGMPKTVVVTSPEIREAIAEPITQIVARVRSVLEKTPPELAIDVSNHGIWLSGGGALLRGLDELIAHETGIEVHIAADPLSCVANGTGAALDQIEMLSETHFLLCWRCGISCKRFIRREIQSKACNTFLLFTKSKITQPGKQFLITQHKFERKPEKSVISCSSLKRMLTISCISHVGVHCKTPRTSSSRSDWSKFANKPGSKRRDSSIWMKLKTAFYNRAPQTKKPP